MPDELIAVVKERFHAKAPDIIEVIERMYESG